MSTEKKPLVTVMICVYNAGEYFRPSLQSILNQTYSNLDIIVVDDGSTDGCIETASDLLADTRVRLFRQANMTKPFALNRALEVARGEFYAQQDADDISYPTRIEKQLAALLSKPDVAAAFCGNELVLNGRVVAPTFLPKTEAECRRAVDLLALPAHDPTGMYRMSLVGGMRYEEGAQGAEGVDYIMRVGEKYPMIVVGECLYQYRILNTSITRSDPMNRKLKEEDMERRALKRRGLSSIVARPEERPIVAWRSVNTIKDNRLSTQFLQSVRDKKKSGDTVGALVTGFQCVMLHPFDIDYYRALANAVIPSGIILSYKTFRSWITRLAEVQPKQKRV